MWNDALTEHVLTIDLGTSGPKVAIFTIDGTFVDGDSEAVGVQLTEGGGAQQRPSDWWQAISAAAASTPTTIPICFTPAPAMCSIA